MNLVANKSGGDVKQRKSEGNFEAAGNVLYGVRGVSMALPPIVVAFGSAYAHVAAHRWDAFTGEGIRNELGDQKEVARGAIATVVCW